MHKFSSILIFVLLFSFIQILAQLASVVSGKVTNSNGTELTIKEIIRTDSKGKVTKLPIQKSDATYSNAFNNGERYTMFFPGHKIAKGNEIIDLTSKTEYTEWTIDYLIEPFKPNELIFAGLIFEPNDTVISLSGTYMLNEMIEMAKIHRVLVFNVEINLQDCSFKKKSKTVETIVKNKKKKSKVTISVESQAEELIGKRENALLNYFQDKKFHKNFFVINKNTKIATASKSKKDKKNADKTNNLIVKIESVKSER